MIHFPRTTVMMAVVLMLVAENVCFGSAKLGSAFVGVRQDSLLTAQKVIEAVRAPDGGISVDGKLNDAVWGIAPISSGFIQHEPAEGEPATERTTVQIAYDDDALYAAIRAYDSEPDKIKGLLTRRDEFSPCDWILIAIDSYGDHRTAFQFGVNPVGVKSDLYRSDDVNEDPNWDAVWDVGVSVDDEGWTAEFRIPFSQLRFSKSKNHIWGFMAARMISRKNETALWKHIPRDATRVVSLFGELRGIEDIPTPRRLQLLPYSVASATLPPLEEGDPFGKRPDWGGALGLDAKYGLTSNVTLDMTVNPDFGQVEADPSEFNLTAYETFFEEKRPFFIEGNNIFSYHIGIEDTDFGNETLFYSRRIGRSPHHYPDISDDGFVDQSKWTSILGAAKITGKSRGGWSIGILEAVTQKETARIEDLGERYDENVEPATNYLVVRTQKDLREGRTTLGGIVTNVTRDILGEDLNDLSRSAFTGGLDFSHRWRDDTYYAGAKLIGSHIRGDREAIDEVQISSARYYQRPDADYLDYDSTRTSLSGVGATYEFGKIGGGHIRWGFGGVARSPGLDLNDVGYLRQADLVIQYGYVGYVSFKPGKVFRDYGIYSSAWYVTNFGGERLAVGYSLGSEFRFLNYWGGFVGFSVESGGLSTSSLRGGPAIRIPARYYLYSDFSTDERKAVSLEFEGGANGDEQGTRSYRIMPGVTVRPSGRFSFSFSLGYIPSINDHQYVDEIETASGTDYVFAHLDQKTLFLTTRLNYTLTPDLSIQFYSMPFITAGAYSGFKNVVAPGADQYEDRYAPYDYQDNPDFNFRQFRSNLVVRWEYSPGSTIFFVWSQGRTSLVEGKGEFSWPDDTRSLFDTQPEDVFLLKISRWFSL